jgi:hypothetical protein
LANAFHLLSHRSVTSDSVGIELNSRRIRVEIVQNKFDLKDVVICVGFDPHVSEAQ